MSTYKSTIKESDIKILIIDGVNENKSFIQNKKQTPSPDHYRKPTKQVNAHVLIFENVVRRTSLLENNEIIIMKIMIIQDSDN